MHRFIGLIPTLDDQPAGRSDPEAENYLPTTKVELAQAPRQLSAYLKLRLYAGSILAVAFLLALWWTAGRMWPSLGLTTLVEDTTNFAMVIVHEHLWGLDETEGIIEFYDGSQHLVGYSFSDGIEEFYGVSYSTNEVHEIGSRIRVKYSTRNPSVSKLENGQLVQASRLWAGAAVSCLFLVSIIFVAGKSRQSCRTIQSLMENGEVTPGRLDLIARLDSWAVELRRMIDMLSEHEIEKSEEYEQYERYSMTYKYTPGDGKVYTTEFSTTETGDLEIGHSDNVIYDRIDPSRSFVLCALPGHPFINPYGRIDLSESQKVTAVCMAVIPVAALALLVFSY